MSRYYSFNDFMNNVLDRADSLCKARDNCGLEEMYRVSTVTYKVMKKLIAKDWAVFLVVVALLAAVSLGLGDGSAVLTLKQMYQDRILPQTVKEIGEKYKEKWSAADGSRPRVDSLKEEAAQELYRKAKARALEMQKEYEKTRK